MRKYVLLLFTLILGTTVIGSACLSYATASDYTVTVNEKVIYTAGRTRINACRQMRTMASAEWTLSKSATYTFTHSGKQLTLLPGKYAGLPYSQPNRTFTNLEKIQEMVDSGKIQGTDCSSSVCFAWRNATSHTESNDNFLKRTNTSNKETSLYICRSILTDALNSGSINTGDFYTGDYLTKVGDYGIYEDYCQDAAYTPEIIRWLTAYGNYPEKANIHSQIYAQTKPGDAIITVTANNTHARMVLGVDIKLDSSGNILPDESTMTTIEQRSKYEELPAESNTKSSQSRISSSWRITDFTFTQLSEGAHPYIPVRLTNIDS